MQLSQMDSLKKYIDVTKTPVHFAWLLIEYLGISITFLCIYLSCKMVKQLIDYIVTFR